jgi:GTP-binding protein LepA
MMLQGFLKARISLPFVKRGPSNRIIGCPSLPRRFCATGTDPNIRDFVQQDKLHDIDIRNIRNFSVIAHVDHGKSTLSDAILQLTGNIDDSTKKKGQVLDTLKVERERGITVKAQTASMVFHDTRGGADGKGTDYLINLIDTPGHVDFSYEVSRSLASCQGALLLVDSTQSIQAQTLVNFEKANALGLEIIPVVTKIDLPSAQPEDAALAMGTTFNVDPMDVIMTSAKAGIGIREVLESVVDKLPSPVELSNEVQESKRGKFHGRIVDSWFDEYRGTVCLIQGVAGTLKEGQKITTYASVQEAAEGGGSNDSKTEFSVQEVGILSPEPIRTGLMTQGQVGYVIAGLRSTRQARIGDTMYIPSEWNTKVEEGIVPLSGYEAAKPMLFASVFPVETKELEALFDSVDRLCLNDSSISVAKDQSSSLGAGLRCGFLGVLHMEVFNQRLSDEFNMNVVMTTPSVPYIVEKTLTQEREGGKKVTEVTREEISSAASWPEPNRDTSFKIFEPIVKVTIVSPQSYYGSMSELIVTRRGYDLEVAYIDGDSMLMTAMVPWQEVVSDMNDAVKNASAGYASFNYEEAGHKEASLQKVEIAVNGEPCDPLSFVCHTSQAASKGRTAAAKLKSVLSRQNFEIILQAKVGAKVLARERIAPYRKDVLTKGGKTVGGGDISRKKKLLEKQKAGKKKAKMIGKVEISQDAFWSVLSNSK